jgi:hypothetical protein
MCLQTYSTTSRASIAVIHVTSLCEELSFVLNDLRRCDLRPIASFAG